MRPALRSSLLLEHRRVSAVHACAEPWRTQGADCLVTKLISSFPSPICLAEELFAQIASCGGPSLNRPGSAPPAQPAASEARPSLPAAPTAEIFEAAAQELGAQADGSSDGVAVEDSAATNGISEAVGKL